MRKTLSLIIALALALGIMPFTAMAHQGYSLELDFDSFVDAEDGQTAPSGISVQNKEANNAGTWAVDDTDRGTIVELKNTPAKQNIQMRNSDIPTANRPKGSFVAEMDINFNDKNVQRHIALRSDSLRQIVFFEVNGNIRVSHNGASTGAYTIGTYETETWYNVKIYFDVPTRAYQVEISDGENTFSARGFASYDLPATYSMWLTHQGALVADATSASTYTDNWKIYTIMPFSIATLDENFNGYTAEDKTAPTGFLFQNARSGEGDDAHLSSYGSSAETDRGRSVKLTNDLGANLEMVRNFGQNRERISSGAFYIKAALKVNDLNSGKKIFVRQTDHPTTSGPQEAVRIDTNGEVYVGTDKVPSLVIQPGKWYDIMYTYDIENRAYRLEVNDGTTIYRLKGSRSHTLTTLNQIQLSMSDTTKGLLTECYWDDVQVGTAPSIYHANSIGFDFSEYVTGEPSGFNFIGHQEGLTEVTSHVDSQTASKVARMYQNSDSDYTMWRPFTTTAKGFVTDIKIADTNASRTVVLEVEDSDKTKTALPAVQFSESGEILIGGTPQGTFETGKWYQVAINASISAGNYVVNVRDGAIVAATATVAIPEGMANLSGYGVTIGAKGAGSAETFIDNIVIIDVRNFGIDTSTPAHLSTSHDPEKTIRVAFSSIMDKGSFNTGSVTLYNHGTQVPIDEVKIVGSKQIEIVTSLEENKNYELRFNNVSDVFGQSFTGQLEFYTTIQNVIIGETIFTKMVDGVETRIYDIEPGEITATIKVSAKEPGFSQPASIMLALYEGDRLIGISRNPVTIDNTEREASASVTVPEEGNYTLKAFLWDNMTPLKQVDKLS